MHKSLFKSKIPEIHFLFFKFLLISVNFHHWLRWLHQSQDSKAPLFEGYVSTGCVATFTA